MTVQNDLSVHKRAMQMAAAPWSYASGDISALIYELLGEVAPVQVNDSWLILPFTLEQLEMSAAAEDFRRKTRQKAIGWLLVAVVVALTLIL